MIYNGKLAAVDHGPIVQFEAGLEKWPAKEERKKGKAGRATLGGEGEGSEGAAEVPLTERWLNHTVDLL